MADNKIWIEVPILEGGIDDKVCGVVRIDPQLAKLLCSGAFQLYAAWSAPDTLRALHFAPGPFAPLKRF